MTGCACGHHHHHTPHAPTGEVIAVTPAPVVATGRLICDSLAQMMTVLSHLPDHVTLSRAEPGCLRFDLAQSDDPMIWTLDELFADDAAFAAHQARTKASDWGRASGDIRRDITPAPGEVRLRRERAGDEAAIAALTERAFGGPDEARLIAALRRDGDLAVSLVAECHGAILGHVALSPLKADGPAFSLAPLSVHPAVRRRGIGTALVRAALDAAAGHTVVVLGDPAYYTRFGFAAADLASPYAGPHLMAAGPALPSGNRITHAPAFAAL